MIKTAIVLGGGGFIGGHLVKRLKQDGVWVRSVDIKAQPFPQAAPDENILGDLRDARFCDDVFDRPFDEVYQLAADMGGAGYVFSGDNDAEIMRNSAAININALASAHSAGVGRIFFASSACIYPARNQVDPSLPDCSEDSAYPAAPDSEYGWEKLFAERLYLAYSRNHGMKTRIARYHNIFGPFGAWTGGREKAPAAICRKVAEAADGGSIEIWGDGRQTRSFLYVDECVEGTLRLMRSDVAHPVNIGSTEMVTINELVSLVSSIANKAVECEHIHGPQGVRGRNSDNRLILRTLGWEPTMPLSAGIEATYHWIAAQAANSLVRAAA